jgi:hypothetical protein
MGDHPWVPLSWSIAAAIVTLMAAGSVGCGGSSGGAENRNLGDCYFETVGQSREELNAAIEDAMNGMSSNPGCSVQSNSLAEVARVEVIDEPTPHFRVWLRFLNSPANRTRQQDP